MVKNSAPKLKNQHFLFIIYPLLVFFAGLTKETVFLGLVNQLSVNFILLIVADHAKMKLQARNYQPFKIIVRVERCAISLWIYLIVV